MKPRYSAAVLGVATLATSAGIVLTGAVAAHAATNPPWEPDGQSVGTITFYDGAGNPVTGGTLTDKPLAKYAVGSSIIRAGDTRAELQEAQPNPNAATTGYNADTLSSVTTFPVTTGPASITGQTNPVVTGSSGDLSLSDFVDEFPNSGPTGPGCAYSASPSGCTNTAYQNLYQLRLKTLDSGGNTTATYDDADILVSGNTWTQVYPAAKTTTNTTLTAAPSPATVGQSVTLTANETPAVAGSVQFKDGATAIGAAVPVDGTGKATKSTTTLAQGSHNLSAVFTPTDTTANNGSTGTTTLVVNPASTPTTTTLVANQDGFAGHDVSLSATVKAGSTAVSAGTVSFYDNSSSTPLNSTPVTPDASGVAAFDIPAGLAQGSHSIVAKFTPTDVTAFQASQSGAQAFFLNPAAQTGSPCAQTGSACTDTQYIQGTIPIGTLVISTPYTQANPLDLGTLALNQTATGYQATAPFSNIVVTDNRAGGLGWTASALATALSDGGSNPNSTINAQNVGLTNLVESQSAGDTGVVTLTDNPAASPAVAPTDPGSLGLGGTAPHTFAAQTVGAGQVGDGTVGMSGVLTLNAPTSTEAGLFKGTITFTVG